MSDKLREAAQMALEALYPISHNSTDDPRGRADEAIKALRESLAEQPVEREPLTDERKRQLNPYRHSKGASSIWLNGFDAAERAYGIGAHDAR